MLPSLPGSRVKSISRASGLGILKHPSEPATQYSVAAAAVVVNPNGDGPRAAQRLLGVKMETDVSWYSDSGLHPRLGLVPCIRC